MKTIKYCIKDTITNDYLISHYGFQKEEWHDTYNLVKEVDKYGLGLHIWWADRSVQILLGGHDEYGIIPIPDLLIQMINDKVIIKKEVDE